MGLRGSGAIAVQQFLQQYRSTVHATTGIAPFTLMTGRRMRSRLSTVAPPKPSYVAYDRTQLKKHVEHKQASQKAYYGRLGGKTTPHLKPGDTVQIQLPRCQKKFTTKFSTPRTLIDSKVLHTLSTVHYVVQQTCVRTSETVTLQMGTGTVLTQNLPRLYLDVLAA